MLNPVFKDMYSMAVLDKLQQFAADMENAGKKALVCFTESNSGIQYPGAIYLDDMSWDEAHSVVQKYFPMSWIELLTGDADAIYTLGYSMSDYNSDCKGKDLWVK